MLIAATFLAAAHTQRERAHVGIEVLDEVMSAKWNRWRYIFGDVASTLFCALIAYLSWVYWHEAWEEGWETSSTWAPKLWIPYFFMALGMTLLVLQYVVQVVEDVFNPAKHQQRDYLGE
jgi:TRAP-type C4-dicarboxylate transport system permease small subunit